MSRRKRKPLFQSIAKPFRRIIQRLFDWMSRRVFILGRQRPSSNAGYILPTVIMVILVVTLLVLTIVFRSFDRAKNASNVRISQVAMEATTPVLERATAKLTALFEDDRIPRGTPSDDSLYRVLGDTTSTKYTFQDETRLSLAYDFGNGSGSGTPNNTLNTRGATSEFNEIVDTAWRFPIDSDNNGKYDSFGLYSVLFRAPGLASQLATNGRTERSPVDARTPPMDEGAGSDACRKALGTSAQLIGEGGWYKSGSKLKKSFYVYAVTVPITNLNVGGTALPSAEYEVSTKKGFAALEYQQDQARIPLSNNAVVFEDDLAIVSGTDLFLNGSIKTNGNLFITPSPNEPNADVALYQVSSPESCFYKEENGKVTVGGHIVNAPPRRNGSPNGRAVPIHLFVQGGNPDQTKNLTSSANQSPNTSESPARILYNSEEYTNRLNHLVNRWTTLKPDDATNVYHADDPQAVKDAVTNEIVFTQKSDKRLEALFNYFKARVRRVPFDEQIGSVNYTSVTNKEPVGTKDSLRPPKEWMFPYDPGDGKSDGSYAKIALKTSGQRLLPQATEPDTLAQDTRENFIGDRVRVGNNLPAQWYKIDNYNNYNSDNTGTFVQTEEPQQITNTVWDEIDDTSKNPRARFTGVEPLDDVGDKSRDGFWEEAAATQPKTSLEGYGGLRIITGAGIYERRNSFLPPPTDASGNLTYDDPTTTSKTETFPIVWPDTMPMSPGTNSKVYDNVASEWVDLPATLPVQDSPKIDTDPQTRKYAKGDMRMRAAAVYHYAWDVYDPKGLYQTTTKQPWQDPIACVSSYYDPTNAQTAGNGNANNADTGAKSNNGVVYSAPSTSARTLGAVAAPNSTTGLFPGTKDSTGLKEKLYHQANLVFPDGRLANEPLRDALIALSDPKNTTKRLTLAQQSAIDSTICALDITRGGYSQSPRIAIPNGAIKEVAFLDARQIQAVDKGTSSDLLQPTGNYDLPIEERQPLEVRATAIDLDLLRRNPSGGTTTFSAFSGQNTQSPSPEYLLPNSGIIYASRDDALPDASDFLTNGTKPGIPAWKADSSFGGLTDKQRAERQRNSPVDYKLDPTRRASGIMVWNGEKLARNNSETFKEYEKGLILATDLSAYVWGKTSSSASTFNPHTSEEFTQVLTQPSWGNFYSRTTLSTNFACRPSDPRLPTCTTGDTWRPATIIADSMTLLSANFNFGYRVDGDYDLRDNQLPQATEKRKKNGFFANNFVTSTGYHQNTSNVYKTFSGANVNNLTDASFNANVDNNTIGSSYFNNFVTPIQRRLNFDEYVMEICRKLPVSECQAEDWGIGGYDANANGSLDTGNNIVEASTFGVAIDLNNDGDTTDSLPETTNITAAQLGQILDAGGTIRTDRLGSGTTAREAILPTTPATNGLGNQRFARRVAFKRHANNQLVLTDYTSVGRVTPILLGRSGSNVAEFPYNTTSYPDDTTNALWYRTTTNTSGEPYNNVTYVKDRLLSYLQPQNEKEEFLLPDVADVAGAANVATTLNGPTPTATPPIDTNDPADYAVCITGTNLSGTGELLPSGSGAQSQKFAMAATGDFSSTGSCPDSSAARAALGVGGSLSATATLAFTTALTQTVALPTATLADNLYIYNLPSGGVIPSGTTITLTGDADSIFVFRSTGAINFGDAATTGVKLVLDGVNPNNIYWLADADSSGSDGSLIFDAAATSPHQLAGNFLGTGALQISAETQIFGGRFLGFVGTTGTENYIKDGATIQAISSQNQPLLAPVLQIHSPRGTPNSSFVNAQGTTPSNGTKWHQRAINTTFNMIMAVGNTPARSEEPDGGLGSFPRFLEDWTGKDARISGSMMEFERSKYATGPYQPFTSTGIIGTNDGAFGYPQGYYSGNAPLSGNQKNSQIPYFPGAPNRLWGFDVGLLSQLPDLFSSRFTSPSAGKPDQFFREVGRDDEWVQTLLCSRTNPTTGTAFLSLRQAINDDQRPTQFCTTHTDKGTS